MMKYSKKILKKKGPSEVNIIDISGPTTKDDIYLNISMERPEYKK